jgi:hypothetical protein
MDALTRFTAALGGCAILAACAPSATPTAGGSPAPQPPSTNVLSAKYHAAQEASLTAKVGAVALKVSNDAKTKGVPSTASTQHLSALGWRWVLDLPATGPVTSQEPDGTVDSVVVIATDSVAPANDGVAGDQVVTEAVTVPTDNVTGETGSETISDTETASGDVKAGEIVYTPDASASATGAVSEDIRFTIPPDQIGIDRAASISAQIGTASAAIQESQAVGGDFTADSIVTQPDGSSAHIVYVQHPNRTRDVTVTASDFSFQVLGIKRRTSLSAPVYDRDFKLPGAIPIGVVTIAGASSSIAFYKADGSLDTPVPFGFGR